MKTMLRTLAVLVALAAAGALYAPAHAQVTLTRLDCVGQPGTHLLVNDSANWATYGFDASMLLTENADIQVYVVRVAPRARLVVCVG